ncbi:MAG: hypothetical protein ACJAZC_000285 [Cryomorphaceae bacterium]
MSEPEKQESDSNFKLGSPKSIPNVPFPEGTRFFSDVSYGPGAEHKLDVFLPPLSRIPAGMVIHYHGGVFIGGDKTEIYDSYGEILYIDSLLRNNIAFATVNYELINPLSSDDTGVFQCFESGKRAIQAIKFNSGILNIDSDKVILDGSSAGAGIALWLALSDDMANPQSSGLSSISTRVKAVVVRKPQATYNFFLWKQKVFQNESLNLPTYENFNLDSILEDVFILQGIGKFLGIQDLSDFGNINAYQLLSQVDLLDKIDSADPPIYIYNEEELEEPVINQMTGILTPQVTHHPYHSAALTKMCLDEGLEIESQIFSLSNDYPEYSSEISIINWVIEHME